MCVYLCRSCMYISYLLAICTSSLEMSKSFATFKLGWFCSYKVVVLYIFWRLTTYQIHDLQGFFFPFWWWRWCVCVWRPDVNDVSVSTHFLTLFFWGLVLNLDVNNWLGWVAIKLQGFSCLCFPNAAIIGVLLCSKTMMISIFIL